MVYRSKYLKFITTALFSGSFIYGASSFAVTDSYDEDVNVHGYKITGTFTKKFVDDKFEKKLVFLNIDSKDHFSKKVSHKLHQFQAQLGLIPNAHDEENDSTQTEEPTSYAKVDLGMANVPVLDQGPHGSCVTFAVTAALNAKFNAGDYISQQCMLALGKHEYLHQAGRRDRSGWNGLWADIALNRIRAHGVVSHVACPDAYPNPDIDLDRASYDYLSLHKQWSSAFTVKNIPYGDVEAAKKELDAGHRVMFATLLNVTDRETAMGYDLDENHKYGYWRFPEDVEAKIEYLKQIISGEIGGHEMVLIGYDDELKRFKIRNSWGTTYGDDVFADHGDFYMSYEFYELMNLDTIALL